MGRRAGIVRTRVGYAGGAHPDPTYQDLGDHSEAFQLDFDPTIVSYADLLDVFWKSHRCDRGGGNTQYMAAVFCENDAQLALATESRDRIATTRNLQVTTPVIAGARFYRAEDYHQKYYLRHDAVLMRELAGYTPRAFVDSTVAARLNGIVGGRGAAPVSREEIESFGLSCAASARLAQMSRR